MATKTKMVATGEHNVQLADLLHKMAACYRYMGDEQRFRALAYEAASKTINGLQKDICTYAKDVATLDQLSGVGPSIGEKILEYLKTGKVKTFERLKKEVPQDLLELMEVNGFGPATIKILHEKLNINNRDELVKAIELGKVRQLDGFGDKKIENMLRGLKLYKESHERMLLWDAGQIGNEILNAVQALPGIKKAELAGSLRRKKETIGDIDIIVVADKRIWKKLVNQLGSLEAVERVIAAGETKTSLLLKNTHLQVDVRIVHAYEFGAALLYFTGSKEHNIKLRLWARERGWKLNEYGVFAAATGKRLAGETEEEIYELFGLQFIPPELREEKGEIEEAAKKMLPKLVEVKNIRGDLQMHSTWSDGAERIETIAQHIVKHYPQYEYIVLTDHSPSERVAGGLQPADFKKQFLEIEKVNKKLGRDLVKKGVEVDILYNGALDLPDELLAQFDWVTASIHSGFSKDNTERLLRACEHPFVNCIGHPSGRIIGKREAYPVDWNALFEKAAATGTALEINAQPNRLDLRDDLVKAAVEKGVRIVISTDAHALPHYAFMEGGVAVARRGWCTKKAILNTGSWQQLAQFRQSKIKKSVLVL